MKKVVFFCAFVALIWLSVVLSISQQHVLISGANLRCKWATDSFILQWRHSVEKQLWQEVYQVKNDKLWLSHSFVQSFGAGVPTQGKAIPAPKGFVGIQNNLELPELNWTVSRRMQGQIMTTQFSFPIYQFVKDYSVVHIQVIKKPRVWWLWQGVTAQLKTCEGIVQARQNKNVRTN